MKERAKNAFKHGYKYQMDMNPQWEWFSNFLRDMGPRPDGMELDRIDETRGYWKDNCRWATSVKQQRNRPTVKLDFDCAQVIRFIYASGEFKQKEIAEVYQVTQAIISKIVRGAIYGNPNA